MAPDFVSAINVRAPIPRQRWLRWWLIALVWWTMDGLASASTYRTMPGADSHKVLTFTLVGIALWVPQTMLALWMAERLPVDRRRWKQTLPVTLLITVLLVVFKALIVQAFNPWVGWYDVLPPLSEILVTSTANNFFLFLLVVGVAHAIVNARRVQEREDQLARAELRYLKAQLHPHFLFNALNTISSFIRTDPETATQMVAHLSTLLRHALQRASTQEVSLTEELSVLAAYVKIEQLRFEDRLAVVWRIDPDALNAQVPHLLLQPLVENAILHGIAPRSELGTVEIAAFLRDNQLHLSVRDDGVGRTVPSTDTAGVGLTNTRNRLQQLYGVAQTLTVATVAPHGVRVDIALPYRQVAVV
jgi:two-component system, LytTR family, sensor kinase